MRSRRARAPLGPSLAPAAAATLLLLPLLLQSVAGLGNDSSAPPAAIAASAPAAAAPAPDPAPATAPAPAPAAPDLLANARRQNKKKHSRSTSSSSGDKRKDDDGGGSSDDVKGQSLSMSSMSELSEPGKDKDKDKGHLKYIPKSSAERHGWRKWHRKCTPCPEMSMRWRDPRVQWICGGYQRARRSFKSACMMRMRNCQDGTMFVKLYNHRCKPDVPGEPRPHGEDFFYTYSVKLSGDSTKSGQTTEEEDEQVTASESGSSEARRRRRRRRAMRPPQPAPAPEPPAARDRAEPALMANTNVTLNITNSI